MSDPNPNDEEEISKASHAAICAALDRLIAAQAAAMRASQLLAEERNRIDAPTSAWGRFDRCCRACEDWTAEVGMALWLGCVAIIPTFALIVILQVVLGAWNAA